MIYWPLNGVNQGSNVINFALLYHNEIIVLPEHHYPAIFLLLCHLLKIKACFFHYNELQFQ